MFRKNHTPNSPVTKYSNQYPHRKLPSIDNDNWEMNENDTNFEREDEIYEYNNMNDPMGLSSQTLPISNIIP